MDVVIFGSCVTRDAFGSGAASSFQVQEYFARSSLASALCSTEFQDPIDLSPLTSSFQRRTVQKDLSKVAKAFLLDTPVNLLVYDAIDERFDLARTVNGSLCTISNEIRAATFDITQYEVIRSGSEEFFALWEMGWERLMSILDLNGRRDRLRVNVAYWAHTTKLGTPSSNYAPSFVDRQNAFLQRMYTRMEFDLRDGQFIRHDRDDLLAAEHHRWGLSPFHYVECFYDSLLLQLGESVRQVDRA